MEVYQSSANQAIFRNNKTILPNSIKRKVVKARAKYHSRKVKEGPHQVLQVKVRLTQMISSRWRIRHSQESLQNMVQIDRTSLSKKIEQAFHLCVSSSCRIAHKNVLSHTAVTLKESTSKKTMSRSSISAPHRSSASSACLINCKKMKSTSLRKMSLMLLDCRNQLFVRKTCRQC